MTKLSTLAFGAILAFSVSIGLAQAEPILIKIGHNSPDGISMPGAGIAAGTLALKDYLEVASAGTIKVEIYPNGSLGGPRALIESTQLGTLQMAGTYSAIMVPFAPEMAITQIPYVFRDNLTAWKVLEGPLGEELAESFLNRTGLRILGWGDGAGFRHIYADRPINSPADMKGMRMRVPENPGLLAMFQAWGANTVTINWSELYTSLQAGMAQGHDTELYSMFSQKLYEVNPYVTMTRHSFNLHPLLLNEEFFQSLSNEHQMLVLQAGDLYSRVTNAHSLTSALTVQAAMEAEGAIFYYPSAEEIAEFRDLAQQPYIDTIVRSTGQEWIDRLFAAAAEAEQQP